MCPRRIQSLIPQKESRNTLMRIQKKVSQHRRDFRAIYECEHCRATHESSGYDDANFHDNVIPRMKCTQCGKAAPIAAPRTAPDVPAHAHI